MPGILESICAYPTSSHQYRYSIDVRSTHLSILGIPKHKGFLKPP